ncbi:MAG: VWA domain-containing protein [Myxococcota bacterium]
MKARRLGWLGALLVGACGPTTNVGGTEGAGTGTESGSDDNTQSPTTDPDGTDDADDTSDTTDPGGETIMLSVNRDIDLLVVLDNSGSMVEEQAALAASIGVLAELFEEVGANYRIGVTTTDDGNPWCTGTTPEAGALRFSSCQARAADFSVSGTDEFQQGCLDQCAVSELDILPTPVAGSTEVVPRPWLEVTGGVSNVAGLSPAEAIRCAVPQGINGCGFEQPLESMYKALQRSANDTEESFGFVRASSVLAILIVTDEADCSYATEQETIFLPDDDRVFWSDPTSPTPTSAVCWNAGVACQGDECMSVNLDPLGSETSEDAAVMRPVSRYVDLLQALEDDKQQITPDQQVVVSLVGGVGVDGSVTYHDSLDPTFQEDFGIGPGCSSLAGEAVPPVRVREVTEALAIGDAQSMFSICESDYTSALQALAAQVFDQMRPACMPACVADGDQTTPAVDPTCVLTLHAPQVDGSVLETEVPLCAAGASDLCWDPLVGADMSNFCAEQGWNLEFGFTFAPGYSLPPGSAISADCALSADKSVDCPGLP